MNFGSDRVADSYDRFLVPCIFDPWAEMLIEHMPPSEGMFLLDVATGTGVVAQKLADRVGKHGVVIAADLNLEMLNRAKQRCAGHKAELRLIQCSADQLDLENNVVDLAYCQQGFQFFQDKSAVCCELMRVLKPGGKIVLSTWLPVSRCHFFGAICEALERLELNEISAVMRKPFDHVSELQLREPVESAGFEKIEVTRHTRSMQVPGDVEAAYQVVLKTPIGPMIEELDSSMQEAFKIEAVKELKDLCGCNGDTYGSLAANVLTAMKPQS